VPSGADDTGAGGPGVSACAPRFQTLRTAAFDLFAAGDYLDVLPFAREAQALYPAKGEVPFWLACVHCHLGDTEGALAAWRAGLARGHYWPAEWLLEDDDLEPLRDRPEIAAIVRESAKARGSAPVPSSRSCSLLHARRAAALRRPPSSWPCTAGARTPTSSLFTGARLPRADSP